MRPWPAARPIPNAWIPSGGCWRRGLRRTTEGGRGWVTGSRLLAQGLDPLDRRDTLDRGNKLDRLARLRSAAPDSTGAGVTGEEHAHEHGHRPGDEQEPDGPGHDTGTP